MLSEKLFKSSLVKLSALSLSLLMAFSAMQLPVQAAGAEAQAAPVALAAEEYQLPASQMTAETDDGLFNENKQPKQVNVHMGDDPSSQVNFTYTTKEDAATRVTLNKQGRDAKTIIDGDAGMGQGGKYFHAIPVGSLEPSTVYEYTVGYGENVYAGQFKTAPASGSKDTIKFAYLADTQVSNATNAKALGATLAEVNNIPNLDFVYIAGDVTDTATNESQWEYLFNNAGAYPNGGQDMFGSNLLAVVQGNHDNNVMYSHINAPAQQGNIVYSFDYGPITFVMLNLETARSNATARAEQKEFLVEAIQEAKDRGQWTAVGFHKSLVTGASHIVDSDVVEARTYWVPVFAELDVDLVLQGHDHVYSRGFVTGEGQRADRTVNEDDSVVNPANAPLYVIGGHAGGLKWYSKKTYTPAASDPIAANYAFLDVNSTDNLDGSGGSDVKQEQVIVEVEVSENSYTINTYMFKYNTSTDTITTPKYLYDSLTVVRDGGTLEPEPSDVKLTTDANLVKNGEYFNVNAEFVEQTSSNTAILRYSYDKTKFEYRGFTSAEGMTLLDTQYTDEGVRFTVMMPEYEATGLGTVLFSAREDADLQNEDHSISLDAEYVLRDETGGKTVLYAGASTSFSSSDGKGSGNNGEFTLIDLSNIVDMFGATTEHEKWNEYRFYDFNGNGEIDIYDICYVAQKIK